MVVTHKHSSTTIANMRTQTSYAHGGDKREEEEEQGKESDVMEVKEVGWVRVCSGQSGPEHVGHVSVGAVDPED